MAQKSDIEKQLQEFLVRGSMPKTARIASALEGIPEVYDKVKMYTGNKLDDTYDALVNLLTVSDSEEGMKIYESKLNQFTSDARKFGGYDDNIVQADTLRLLGNQKKQMYTDFSTSIQDSSDFINTTQFLDTADDFVNIQDTIDRLNKDLKAKNKTEHGSVADFLQSELANANSLRDNMVAGFQIDKGEIVGTNFRYNKAETNDKETFRKLNLYRDRLELAVRSLAGDKMISPEEAEAIIIGDEGHYMQTKGAALIKAQKNYEFNRARVVQWSGLENTAIQNKLKAEKGETDFLAVDIDSAVDEETDASTYKELSLYKKAQDWDGLIKALADERGEYQELRNIANKNYKNWSGSFFETLEGGLTQEEIEAFNLKLEQEQEELEKLKKLDEEKKLEDEEKKLEKERARLETTKQRYEEPKEAEKAQTYDIDEESDAESLLAGYVSGNVSESVLKNIGGQSLLNRARVMKNAYKGQLPKATVIPGIKTKGITPVGMEYLKTTNFKNPGKSGTFSWEDISSEIHSKGENISTKVETYLSGKGYYDVRWKWRRSRIRKIKRKFQQSDLSIDEFRKKYPEDYKALADVLANLGGKPYRYK